MYFKNAAFEAVAELEKLTKITGMPDSFTSQLEKFQYKNMEFCLYD